MTLVKSVIESTILPDRPGRRGHREPVRTRDARDLVRIPPDVPRLGRIQVFYSTKAELECRVARISDATRKSTLWIGAKMAEKRPAVAAPADLLARPVNTHKVTVRRARCSRRQTASDTPFEKLRPRVPTEALASGQMFPCAAGGFDATQPTNCSELEAGHEHPGSSPQQRATAAPEALFVEPIPECDAALRLHNRLLARKCPVSRAVCIRIHYPDRVHRAPRRRPAPQDPNR